MIRITELNNIVTLTLNRAGKHNALSAEMIRAIHVGLDEVEQNADMRVLILAGEGRSFCAGMDLKDVIDNPPAMGEMLHELAKASLRIRSLQVPTIARVQGAAVGGGCGLMVVCDFAFTHPESKVGYPEVDLGVCPAVVAPWLIKKIGAGKARAMLLAGGTISGKQGFEAGLATHLCDLDDLPSAVTDFAENLAKGGKNAISTTKHWLNELDGSLNEAMLQRGADLSAKIIAGDEAQERLRQIYAK
ncbi:MAG TPA: enoyl-CoA hydratase/isomerase family protein [Phycisphaerales bacterium]|jgi:methylglutaconyl-CoA hydratase|nr:enoyl-CoA hydratase/isomerase family protein [Phycisphaerales bacterium]HIB01450.1 enoyl-CoA hydratase/isomerase family protein [Phycisphaerales bacterium]HIB51282.1 enoyl-CoA hydratase/isomerase family protein [Phycisphaerales bacterium]HIN84610.1 enoyl-CoA hydratase/isomerase family protein [Phycisphaerales bacterium]HIO20430.1 enoyl-CoA hydratase/isomerase family protein [Phycisphaerales bacterium]